MKKCTKCLKLKPLEEFYRDKSHKDGRRSSCKKCFSVESKIYNSKPEVKESTRNRQKKYHAQPDVKILKENYRLRVKYGLTIEGKEQMLESQGNRCEICRDRLPVKEAYVDHDHETDKVRGILCNHCNRGLGGFKDNLETIGSAVKYIERFKD